MRYRRELRRELQGEIQLSGAFALYPMAVKWAEEFRKIHPKVRIDISAGGAGKGITDALAKVVDLGMVSRDIYPQELESALLADPRVREVTAYGFRSPSGVQIGLKLAGDFGSVREVRALCRDVLPAYAMPAKIECLLELDKNGSGKLKRGEEHAGI